MSLIHSDKSGSGNASVQEGIIKLFIVEDYYLIRVGLISALEEFPQLKFIGEAESAEEGLEKLEKSQPDVLILDLGLPGMNGIEMAQEVRKRWPGIRIIILTSHNQPEEVIAALGAGAHAYALKEIKPSRLADVIEMIQEGASWLDPAIANVALSVFSQENVMPPQEPNSQSNPRLSAREQTILRLLVQGKNNPEIAEELCVSVHTVKVHVSNIFQKLSVNDRVQAAVKALKENIV